MRVKQCSQESNNFLPNRFISSVSYKSQIFVSDRCIFNVLDNNKCLLENVLHFRYGNGKKIKQYEYSKNYAEVNQNNIRILRSYFKIMNNTSLQPISLDFHGYTPISSYRRTIPCPDIGNTEFYTKPNIYDDVKIFF